jgi:uncharacterized protein YutE (UPF0331/DUF86 family)
MRIFDKIKEIENYLADLDKIVPQSFDEYKKDIVKKAACERYFEKITEALVDLAFIFIKEKGFKIPEEDKGAFDLLAEEKIISSELSEKLKDAKGMRNIIAHEYGKIDDELVFYSITDEIIEDSEDLIRSIKRGLE